MKSYALLVGVNESIIPNVPKLRGAKFDVEKLDWMLDQSLNKQYAITKLDQSYATWGNFLNATNQLKTESQPSFLFLYFTGHTKKTGNVNYVCFQDREVDETSFLNAINMPGNFMTFVVINSCYAKELLNPGITFNGPVYFILSSGINIESPASPTPASATYFTNYFVDTWREFNYLNFNYDQFTALLEENTKKGLKVSKEVHNDTSGFFEKNVPLANKPNNPSYTSAKTSLYVKTDLYDYIQVTLGYPQNTYSVLDSFTVDITQNRTDDFINALVSMIDEHSPGILEADGINLDEVQFIGVVFVKLGDTKGPYPHNINYLYSENLNANSNGLVVFLNTENDLQIVARERTSGRVTNKIGGL